MISHANPKEKALNEDFSDKQTVEFRCPDGSADLHLLMAGLVVAARHGFEMQDPLAFAKKTYVDVDIFKDKQKLSELSGLPTSCWESAEQLEKQKSIYTKYGVFTEGMLNWIIEYLRKYNDQNIREEIGDNEEKLMELVNRFFHCG